MRNKIFFIFLAIFVGGTMFFLFPQTTKAQVIITFETLPAATEGNSYFHKLKAEGGQEPYTWGTPYAPGCVAFAPMGALPLASEYGFSLSPNGEISAQVVVIPKKQNLVLPVKHEFYVGAKDNKRTCAASRKFTIEINSAEETPQTTAVQITSKSPLDPGATKNKPYQYQFSATGGLSAEYEWFFEDKGSLAEFNPSLAREGLLAVTPTKTGSYQFRIWVRNKRDVLQTDTTSFALLVSSGESLEVSSPSSGILGQEYNQTLYVSGGTPPYNPQIEEKPFWLTYNIATGSRNEIYLGGAPSNKGVFSLKIKAVDSSSPAQVIQKDFTIEITPEAVVKTSGGKQGKLEVNWPSSPMGTPLNENSKLVDLIKYLYEWGIGIGGFLAFIALLIAGFRYLTSVGNAAVMKDAMDRMQSAVLGLLLLLGSFLILNTINPQLTELKMPTMTPGERAENLTPVPMTIMDPFIKECNGAILYSGPDYSGSSIPLSGPKDQKETLSQEVGSVVIEGSCQLTLYKLTGFRENADNVPTVITGEETPNVEVYGTTKFGSAKLNNLYVAP